MNKPTCSLQPWISMSLNMSASGTLLIKLGLQLVRDGLQPKYRKSAKSRVNDGNPADACSVYFVTGVADRERVGVAKMSTTYFQKPENALKRSEGSAHPGCFVSDRRAGC